LGTLLESIGLFGELSSFGYQAPLDFLDVLGDGESFGNDPTID
jgi:hypothetical protein